MVIERGARILTIIDLSGEKEGIISQRDKGVPKIISD